MQSRYTFEDDRINKVHQDFGRYPRRCFSCGLTSSVQRRAADLPTASVCADDVRATRCPTRPLQCVVRAATVATSPKKAQTN
jgi:hypothetical protein